MGRLQDLNGIWEYRVGGGAFRPQKVLFSALPVGRCEVRTAFSTSGSFVRAFIRFEGVAYRGEARLNGAYLGEMLAYAPYRFEITDLLRAGSNEL